MLFFCVLHPFSSFSEIEIDSTFNKTSEISSENLIGDRKNKKVKKKKRPNTPSKASLIRLKNQSKSAKRTFSRTNKGNKQYKKAVLKQQKRQKKFSRNRNYHRIKKLNFDKKTKRKKNRRVRGLDAVKTRH